MDTIPLWLPFVFFAIALVYATVGFGGGSSYLAALALLGLPHTMIPQVALVCNALVSAGGVWHFHRAGHVALPRVFPFVLASIPMAYLGGRIPVGPRLFAVLLGLSLLAAALRMMLTAPETSPRALGARRAWALGLPIGALLGLLAGLVGIGGGVFLAPLLVLTRWSDAKGAAGAAAVFILVNSIAGLAGQFTKGVFVDATLVPLALAVVLGGQVGSRLGSRRLPVPHVRKLLSALVLIVSLRTLWGAF